MCLVHMNNKAAGSDWLGLHFAACVHEGLLPAWRSSSYWLETDRKCCLNIMKTQIWVYSFHNFSLAAAILFRFHTPHLCSVPIFLHRKHFSANLWLVCKLTCTPIPLASCPVLLLFFVPRSSASLSPFCFNIVYAAGCYCWHSLERLDWTADDSKSTPTLHAIARQHLCKAIFKHRLILCAPPGVSEKKNPKVGRMRAYTILANETIGTLKERCTAQIGGKEAQRCRGNAQSALYLTK